jgi:hypothetical protein
LEMISYHELLTKQVEWGLSFAPFAKSI